MVASYEGVTDAVKAAEPALSTLAQTSLGALAVVSTAIAVLAVWKLSKTQEKAVERAETASKRMEGLITQMTTAFSTVLAPRRAPRTASTSASCPRHSRLRWAR